MVLQDSSLKLEVSHLETGNNLILKDCWAALLQIDTEDTTEVDDRIVCL